MKKVMVLLFALLLLSFFVSCDGGPFLGSGGASIEKIKQSAKDAGYIITDDYVDFFMNDTVGGFSVDINSTIYSVIESGSEEAVTANCKEIDDAGYNISLRNGKIFTCYGVDDSDAVKDMLQSIIDNAPIPFVAEED